MAAAGTLATDAETIAAAISTSGALLGVVLGGLFTVLVDSLRRGRLEQRLERAAGRLLLAELTQSRDMLRRIAERRAVRREEMPGLVPSWEQYRELLASRMDQASWEACAHAVLALRRTSCLLEPFTASDTGAGQLPRHLAKAVADASIAVELAAALLGDGGPPGRSATIYSA